MGDRPRLGSYGAVVCDVDGVLHVGGDPLPGAATWIETVQRAGLELLLVTNASWERGVTMARLSEAAIRVAADLVVTSGEAVVDELTRNGIRRVAVLGAGSVTEAAAGSGLSLVDPREIVEDPRGAALVLGVAADHDAARSWLRRLVPMGVPVLATNRDAVYAGAEGVEIGTGGLIDRLESEVAGLEVRACGKPFEPMARVVRRRLGTAGPVLVVGDNPDVDVAFALRLGADSLLVLTGTASGAGESRPTFVVDDLEGALELMGEGS